jgi:iron complex outermembrane receptor protein
MENEGGGAISLNMHLLTAQYLAKWEKQLNEKNRLILSNLGSFEINTNYGSRKIVPDALMQESNLSAYLESSFNKYFIVETGVGLGEKRIRTLLTPTVNTAEKEIPPYLKNAFYYNGFAGLSYFPSTRFNIKFNASTGVRIPNLAELSSNGLHEGIFTYEIGNPALLNEQNFAANGYVNFILGKSKFGVSPFVNRFLNYVYLAPTSESWFGFPIYRYLQQNALQYGSEFYFEYDFSQKLKFNFTYSGMVSRTDDGNFTPYTPAQKFTPSLFYQVFQGANQSLSFFINSQYNEAQHNTFVGERGSPRYNLINTGLTYKKSQKNNWNLSLAVNNLANVAYYDNLSRFKNYSLLNMGRNITFTLRIMFGENK